ncbi:MAG: S-layer protein [Candidatus Woesearchaeota archaeon]|nr:S-layer protein [Candidatus Woesearchaeota archaeon]
MYLVQGTEALPCVELQPEHVRATASPLAIQIIKLLAEESLHASAVAERLGEPEQKIHYHIKRLREAGLIAVDHIAEVGSAKVLRLEAPAYAVRFKDFKQTKTNPAYQEFLSPFIRNGKWDAQIVVGSPDPHGPEGARSRDGSYAIDLGLFFGTFLEFPAAPAVVLDTELRDWKQHLIVIGGPIVNKAAEKLNDVAPIWYEKRMFVTDETTYDHEHAGIIVKMPNPLAQGKSVLWIAGKHHTGTRAAIVALVKHFAAVCTQDVSVVAGLDTDSDGVIDDARFL